MGKEWLELIFQGSFKMHMRLPLQHPLLPV